MYKTYINESVSAIYNGDTALNTIIDTIVNEGKVELLDEIKAADIGHSIIQIIKRIASYIISTLEVVFTYFNEAFNKNYRYFKKYKYLAGTKIDFNADIDIKTYIKSVAESAPENLDAILGKVNAINDKVFYKISDPKFVSITLPKEIAGLYSDIHRTAGVNASDGQNVDPAIFNKEICLSLIRNFDVNNSKDGKFPLVEHKKISSVCKNNGEVKKMLAFLSNRRPMTAMAVSKRKVRLELNKIIAAASKENGASSEYTKNLIKSCNVVQGMFTSIIKASKNAHAMLARDYRTILVAIANTVSKDDKKNADEIKSNLKNANGNSYFEFD